MDCELEKCLAGYQSLRLGIWSLKRRRLAHGAKRHSRNHLVPVDGEQVNQCVTVRERLW